MKNEYELLDKRKKNNMSYLLDLENALNIMKDIEPLYAGFTVDMIRELVKRAYSLGIVELLRDIAVAEARIRYLKHKLINLNIKYEALEKAKTEDIAK